MQMDKLSASVEEACLNAWPALKEIFYDGWLIRVGRGETRRTNSVNVLGRGRYEMGEKIAYCDAVYRAHGLPTYFRIRSTDDPALERELAAGGFRAEDETRTLFMDFARTPPMPVAGVAIEIAEGAPAAEWLEAHARFTGRAPDTDDLRRRLLELVALPVAFAAARDEAGEIVSVAYGALHDRLVSLQWVATAPARRRQGLSFATLSALLHWARQQGAAGACLQVLAENFAAIRLYEDLGFDRELYRYHYRVR
ncbi:MAG: GNAT family N-acetyltransferase [Alphaproteobacteria bacterium]|nr:GNAT family N-acetyltransferase [Alphaproteobacteria bacterium]